MSNKIGVSEFMRFIFLFCLVFKFSFLFGEDLVSNAAIFSDIYKRGEWGVDANKKGTSGSGSNPQNAKLYITFLQTFLSENNIKSVVDLGCGDWQIGKVINWDGIKYLGVDVVDSIISENAKTFSASNITFLKADGIDYILPKADLLICKDVLQHLPFKDIQSIIKQFEKYKYCIVINDVDPIKLTCENVDIPRGYYRYLDVTKPPFSLLGRKVLSYASGDETKQLLLIKNN